MPERVLVADQVDVDWVRVDEVDIEHAEAAYLGLLEASERARYERYLFGHTKHELLTRALVRTNLSRYTSVEPGSFRFRRNP